MEDQPGRRSDTSRDQRRDVKLMHRLGYTQAAISLQLDLSINQVQYAISQPETPKRRSGRNPILSEAQIQDLVAFISASKTNRRTNWRSLPKAMGWDISWYCIRRALIGLGYKRYIAY